MGFLIGAVEAYDICPTEAGFIHYSDNQPGICGIFGFHQNRGIPVLLQDLSHSGTDRFDADGLGSAGFLVKDLVVLIHQYGNRFLILIELLLDIRCVGFSTLKPDSSTKTVVTIKKMSRMNTISIIGEMLILF